MTLCVENLHVQVADKSILQGADLVCRPGQFTALCGLLKAITGEVVYQRGRVTLQGRDIATMSSQALALRRAVLPQHVDVAFPFSVYDVIEMALLYTGDVVIKQSILNEVMAMLSLHPLRDRDYMSLSDGERQRVQLARVLTQLHQPASRDQGTRYVLRDECTSAMDMAWMHKTFAILRQCCNDKMGIVAVVHDLNLASLYVDEIILLDQSQTLYSGCPQTVITKAIIEEVFTTPVEVICHPQQNKPVVIQSARCFTDVVMESFEMPIISYP